MWVGISNELTAGNYFIHSLEVFRSGALGICPHLPNGGYKAEDWNKNVLRDQNKSSFSWYFPEQLIWTQTFRHCEDKQQQSAELTQNEEVICSSSKEEKEETESLICAAAVFTLWVESLP